VLTRAKYAAVEVAGNTYAKFVRAPKSADAAMVDACVAQDQEVTAVYALGQITKTASHQPLSALETLGELANNTDFYKEDELKYHGGGINSGSPQRGALAQRVNLFTGATGGAPAGAGCTPSTLAPDYACETSRLSGMVTVHYNPYKPGDTAAKFAVQTPHPEGWVGMGFGTMMTGSTAVVATESAKDGKAGVYFLGAPSPDAVVEDPAQAAFTVSEVCTAHMPCAAAARQQAQPAPAVAAVTPFCLLQGCISGSRHRCAVFGARVHTNRCSIPLQLSCAAYCATRTAHQPSTLP
jgi:hypothetical protein